MISREAFLESDPVRRFLDAISLADGFAFFVLVSPAPLETRLCLEALKTRLNLADGELHWLVPPLGDADTPFSEPFTATQTRWLNELVSPNRAFRVWGVELANLGFPGGPYITAGWDWFFARLNEHRNTISQANPRPMVFVVDRQVENHLVHSAPDLWSIRSGSYLLDSVGRTALPQWKPTLGGLVHRADELLWVHRMSMRVLEVFAASKRAWEASDSGEVIRILEQAKVELPEATDPLVFAPAELKILVLEASISGWASIEPRYTSLVNYWLKTNVGGSDTEDGISEVAPYVLIVCGLLAAVYDQGDWSKRCFSEGLRRLWGVWAGGLLYRRIPSLIDDLWSGALAHLEYGSAETAVDFANWAYAILSLQGTKYALSEVPLPTKEHFERVAALMSLLGDTPREYRLRELAAQAPSAGETP